MLAKLSALLYSGLFLDGDLTFIFTPTCRQLLDVDTDLPYHAIIEENPFTPIRQIVLCQTKSGFVLPPGSNYFDDYASRPTERSPRTNSIFVRLQTSPRISSLIGMSKCEYLILSLALVFWHGCIFGLILPHRDAECFKRAAKLLGRTKLIIFEDNLSKPLLLPCLTCTPITFSKLEIASFSDLRHAWDVQNRDMNKYSVLVMGSTNGTCALINWRHADSTAPKFCELAAVSEKYNLTVAPDPGEASTYYSFKNTRSTKIITFT